ncbi:hypothetical protein MRX96_010661 [Rhipicephalus microplus]
MRPRCAPEYDPGCQRGTQPHLVTYRSHAGQQETLCRFSTVATNSPSTPAWAPDLPDGGACRRRSSQQRWITPSCRSFRYRKSAASSHSPPAFFFSFRSLCLELSLLSPPSREQRAERTVNDPSPTVSACAASCRGTWRDVHI